MVVSAMGLPSLPVACACRCSCVQCVYVCVSYGQRQVPDAMKWKTAGRRGERKERQSHFLLFPSLFFQPPVLPRLQGRRARRNPRKRRRTQSVARCRPGLWPGARPGRARGRKSAASKCLALCVASPIAVPCHAQHRLAVCTSVGACAAGLRCPQRQPAQPRRKGVVVTGDGEEGEAHWQSWSANEAIHECAAAMSKAGADVARLQRTM